MENLDGYILIKLNQIRSKYNTEKAVLLKSYYNQSESKNLNELFMILHSTLNDLFLFLNSKNYRGQGGHFNADPSRDLIDIIETIKVIQANIKEDFEISFSLDEEYNRVIEACSKFLSGNGGSTIPNGFPKISIIESRAIFSLDNFVEIGEEKNIKRARIEQIGRGSYSTVFEFKDSFYDTKFAMKRAFPTLTKEELVRFENEYKYLKTLDSPFIIKAYGYDDKNKEYTMELADQTLEKYILKDSNKLSFLTRKALLIQLLRAFEYIHEKGMLHRDISYQNILVKHHDDGTSMIKVSDFGLVKAPESTLTENGASVKGAINDSTDLTVVGYENYEIRHETYALAKVVYFILTGKSSNFHLEKNDELKAFILKAISPDKEKRFTDINELREILLEKVLPSLKKKLVNA